jgi:hypothetical protein
MPRLSISAKPATQETPSSPTILVSPARTWIIVAAVAAQATSLRIIAALPVRIAPAQPSVTHAYRSTFSSPQADAGPVPRPPPLLPAVAVQRSPGSLQNASTAHKQQ